ncbi:glycosyltransferase family 2 protein [Halopiger aswanensis]|uniref:Glycosyl transferase family 2 n=1 Tax=Halopiger aswanensis TaxID=148449 RepID=A0A3R7FYB1_9EURY|nr:glycosyltransferase family A protein [Halopiger aswanensis]RKD98057.1 glycosyl transferase family 2 [Halopiger aswanensis]
MSELALGVTVFKRPNKLKNLLHSVKGDQIDRVIIADNGNMTEEKREIYNNFSKTDITVLDIEYDSGLGNSRKQIVDELNEEYLLIVDSDIELPKNVVELRDQLEIRSDLGGVGGILWEEKRIRSDCYDLYDQGNIIFRGIRGKKEVKKVANAPLVEFDVIQNVAIFRRECLEDYCWDPKYKIGWEHTDFFLGHMQNTNWEFAVNPNVIFKHNPGGDNEYMKSRKNRKRLEKSKKYFLQKWGYKQVVNGQVRWLQSNDGILTKRRLFEESIKRVLLTLPVNVQVLLMRMRDKLRYLKGKPPF